MKIQIKTCRNPYKFWTQGSLKIAQKSLKTSKIYSCASLFQLKHHYSLRCWNHLALWMHSFVSKIPFSHASGKTEVESKIINALKWFVCLSGNPPTVFPECRSLNPHASVKEKRIQKLPKIQFRIWVGKEVASRVHSVLMKLSLFYLMCSWKVPNTELMFEVISNQIWLQGFSATATESHGTPYVSLG